MDFIIRFLDEFHISSKNSLWLPRFVPLLFLILVSSIAEVKGQTTEPATKGKTVRFCGKKLVCLFNPKSHYSEGFAPEMIVPEYCTHINYEFAMLDPTKYELVESDKNLDIDLEFMKKTTDLKSKGSPDDLKVLLAIGGWYDSTKKYSDLIASPEKRQNFIEKAIAYLKEKKFDGMDMAFEYPNCWQGHLHSNKNDKTNFATFLEEAKTAFEADDLLLTVSVSAIKSEILAGYDVPSVSKNVDWLNVMTYDMHGPWEGVTSHHTQFLPKAGDKLPFFNMKSALDVWVENGADPSKIMIGLATYGRSSTLKDPGNFGLGVPIKGPGKPGPKTNQEGYIAYNEVCELINAGKFVEEEDPEVGFYFHSEDQWIGMDPPLMFVRKAKYIVEGDFGGAVIKYVNADDYEGKCENFKYPLIKMLGMEIVSAFRNKQKSNNETLTCKRSGKMTVE